jgi:hypothetical protein
MTGSFHLGYAELVEVTKYPGDIALSGHLLTFFQIRLPVYDLNN